MAFSQPPVTLRKLAQSRSPTPTAIQKLKPSMSSPQRRPRLLQLVHYVFIIDSERSWSTTPARSMSRAEHHPTHIKWKVVTRPSPPADCLPLPRIRRSAWSMFRIQLEIRSKRSSTSSRTSPGGPSGELPEIPLPSNVLMSDWRVEPLNRRTVEPELNRFPEIDSARNL